MKEPVIIPGPPDLEGLLEYPAEPARGGAVVAHPHPLYGGTMIQPVVHHVAQACRQEGLVTLRFNFRGVGRSHGQYDGIEEWRDVQAASRFLVQRLGRDKSLILAGYSFGAWMALLAALNGVRASAVILVAFPMVFEHLSPATFDGIGVLNIPVLSICGQYDDIAPPAQVEAFFARRGLRAQQVLIPGSDHFFIGEQEEIMGAVRRFLCGQAGRFQSLTAEHEGENN